MNVNITIQYDADKIEMDASTPLTFAQIASIRESVNAPAWASFKTEEADFGWEIYIHWNTDVRGR